MPRNIEIKARIPSVASIIPLVTPLATEGPVEIAQDDTFFACERGRLKLRALTGTEAEIIFYRREDKKGPKESFFVRTPISDADSLRDTLHLAYGITGRVIKKRTLFMVGRTRVRLDRVQDLGEFFELEVLLRDDEPIESGVKEAHELMARLGVGSGQLIEDAYVDLLNSRGS